MTRRSLSLYLAGALVGSALFAQSAKSGGCLGDPQYHHTNGMPIASSDPHRTTSVNWSCNPDQFGYCGGHYNWPCWNVNSSKPSCDCESVVAVTKCATCQARAWQGPAILPAEGLPLTDGLEGPQNLMLGDIPSDGGAAMRAPAAVAPLPAAAPGGAFPFSIPGFGGP